MKDRSKELKKFIINALLTLICLVLAAIFGSYALHWLTYFFENYEGGL